MTTGLVIDLVREAVIVILLVSAPILIVSVVIGLLISIIQTSTSIQEQTLTFVPKIVAVMFAMIYFGFFMVDTLRDFAIEIFARIPEMIR